MPTLTHIVKKFIGDVLEATPPTPKQVDEDPLLAKEWSSLTQLKNYLEKETQVKILEFNGFELIVQDNEYTHIYTLGDRLYKKEKGPTEVSPFYTSLILGENQLLIV